MATPKRLLTLFITACYFVFWFGYFAWFWSHAWFMESGNLFAGHVNLWGDWAAHFTMATAIAQRGLAIQSPLILGQPFSYPFVMEAISAGLMRMGVELIPAMVWPSFFASCFFIVALWLWHHTTSKSWAVAIVASIIFLGNGGWGFVFRIQEALATPAPLTEILNPVNEYTRVDEHTIKWISVIDSMMIPQRAFTLGFPVGLLVLSLTWQWFHLGQLGGGASSTLVKKHFATQLLWRPLVIGLLAGTLPIVHTHTFLALGIIIACWSLTHTIVHRGQWPAVRAWGVFAISTLAVALPLWWQFFRHNAAGDGFFHFYPGWLANEYHVNWLEFWWLNWGITPILLAIATIWWWMQHPRKTTAWLALPFAGLWAAANLITFQPWPWDNTKILVWAWVGMAGLLGWFFVAAWRQPARLVKIVIRRTFLIIVFTILIFSGAMDAYRILRTDLHSYQEYSGAELMAAKWVKEMTPVDSIWLTGNPHNHWLFNLTGRQAVMTYPGWLWTHGYNWMQVYQDVPTMYAGNPETALPLLQQYGVDYVVVSPIESSLFSTNEQFFQRFTEVYTDGETRIYRVK